MEKRKTNRTEGAVKRLSMSTAAFVLTAVLIFGCAVGGTLAWLTDKEDPVTNTFVLGQIDLTLEQAGMDNGRVVEHGEFYFGSEGVDCEPKVTIGVNSVKCYLFVKVETSENFNKVANAPEFIIDGDNEWKVFSEEGTTSKTYVLYRVCEDTIGDATTPGAPKEFNILKANANGKEIVPKTNWDASTSFELGITNIKFTAYAVQYSGIAEAATEEGYSDPVAYAWDQVKNLGTNP